MKPFIRNIAVVIVLALATTFAAQAQNASSVEYGRTVLTFDPSFLSNIAGLGAQIGGVGFSSVDSNGVIVFPVVGGVVDLQTSQGEVDHIGGFSANANGIQLRLQSFVIDTTGSPILTALLIVNNKLVGRIPLFNLAPPSIPVPLQTTAGVLQVNGFGVTFNASGAATINAIFGNNAIPAGMLVGTLNVYAVLSPNSAS